ncbi:MAG: response regulator [Silvibacterium sp.]
MPNKKTNVLIVDDEISIRQSLSFILAESGYSVCSAEDGFSALVEIRNEIPDIILSDLNMPGMSGFELLSVVRRRFPVIRVIAMSGAFSGKNVPPGVIADAFYEKGSSPRSLLQLIETMSPSREKWRSPQHQSERTPIWLPRNGHHLGDAYVMISCPECLRAFPQVLGDFPGLVHQTDCAFCHSLIDYAIVQPADSISLHSFQWNNQGARQCRRL